MENVINTIGSEPQVACILMDGIGIYSAADTERDKEKVTCKDFPSAAPRLPSSGKYQ